METRNGTTHSEFGITLFLKRRNPVGSTTPTEIESSREGEAPAEPHIETGSVGASPSREQPDAQAKDRWAEPTLQAPVRWALPTKRYQGLEPVTVSVPFPKGKLTDPRTVQVVDPDGNPVVSQAEVLATWTGGSVKWLRLDFLAVPDERTWEIAVGGVVEVGPMESWVHDGSKAVWVLGEKVFVITKGKTRRLFHVYGKRGVTDPLQYRVNLTFRDDRKEIENLEIQEVDVEANGPLCKRVRIGGRFQGGSACRFSVRLTVYKESELLRADVTLHNPGRAKHAGGLWDLGDQGSILIREFGLLVAVDSTTDRSESLRDTHARDVEFYQESSGGESWQCRTHVNRLGQIPLRFRGNRTRTSATDKSGDRLNPVVTAETTDWRFGVAVPGFWQEFPKSLELKNDCIKVGLFPAQYPDLHELQGGERKTHTVWFDFGEAGAETNLDWVYNPIVAHLSPEWYAASGAIRDLSPATENPGNPLDTLLAEAGGPEGLIARREIIDEYGWRNFGEVYADHEAAYYEGPPPCISHYNNQYDMIRGFAIQFLRTGDPRWVELFEPLAKHVSDIDIYHTQKDKAAYNGGLFWFTDHYKDAATCTHRTYSKANCKPGDTSYGGGPSAAHNFSAGLLLAHYLTGNPDYRDAVLELADWVIAMDDGRKTPLSLIDRGPTGLASFTFDPDYHGPGRGAGNSIAVLLDGWKASGDRKYLEKAEELIRRTVHPDDVVESRDLLNVELRWSYTIYLSALARYLDDKAEAGELDETYAYVRASLVRYALWMLEHERPYFDKPEQLEFPTEAWAGQELRKGNVLRLAARHAEASDREALARRGDELAARGWSDLFGFSTRTSARALALAMGEGARDVALRGRPIEALPAPAGVFEFGPPQTFISQKRRVLAPLRAAKRLIGR